MGLDVQCFCLGHSNHIRTWAVSGVDRRLLFPTADRAYQAGVVHWSCSRQYGGGVEDFQGLRVCNRYSTHHSCSCSTISLLLSETRSPRCGVESDASFSVNLNGTIHVSRYSFAQEFRFTWESFGEAWAVRLRLRCSESVVYL